MRILVCVQTTFVIDTGEIAANRSVTTRPTRISEHGRCSGWRQSDARRGDCGGALEDELERRCQNIQPAKRGASASNRRARTAATVIPLSRAEACRRIRKIYPQDRDRQILCESGLDRYYTNGE